MNTILTAICLSFSLSLGLVSLAFASPKAEKGVLSLESWNGTQNLPLDGEWFFFPGEFLEPASLVQRLQNPDSSQAFSRVGQSFSEALGDEGISDLGFATYAIKIDPGQQVLPVRLGLLPNQLYTASRLYLFGEDGQGMTAPVGQLGTPGKAALSSAPRSTRGEAFPLTFHGEQPHYLMIHLSNYFYKTGGIRAAPILGDYAAMQQATREQAEINWMVIGVILVVAIYNFLLFLNRREDLGSLFFTLFCSTLLIRLVVISTVDDNLLGRDRWNFELYWKVIYLTMGLPGVLFMQFLRCYFPKQTPKLLLRCAWITVTLYALPVIMLPTLIFGPISIVGKFLTLASTVTPFVILIRAARAREAGALTSLIGGLALLVTSILDLVSTLQPGGVGQNTIGYGICVFVVFQMQIIAMHFARAFQRAEALSLTLKDEVERQIRDIQAILKSIKQGILMIVSGRGEIGLQYSEATRTLLNCADPQRSTVSELLFDRSQLGTDEKSQVNSVLEACMGEDVIGFESNSTVLPRELDWQTADGKVQRSLELDWTPICDRAGRLEKMMLCLRDVTEIRELQNAALQHEEDMRILQEIIDIPEDRFHSFLAKTQEYLKENRELVLQAQEGKKQEVIRQLFVNMHTIKGTARSYYLRAIAEVTHEVEQGYANIQKGQVSWDTSQLLEDLDRVHALIHHYRSIGVNKLGWALGTRLIKVSRRDLMQQLDCLRPMRSAARNEDAGPALTALSLHFARECYDDLQSLLGETIKGFDSIARDLKKAPPILKIEAPEVFLTDEGTDLITSIMTHIFRNSMDHGIEEPSERVARGKLESGTIFIHAEYVNAGLVLTLQDDGRGLNLIAVERKAQELNLFDPKQSTGDHELSQLIFHPGLSTKELVTEISGRGVGLDVVKVYLESAGGWIEVELLRQGGPREAVPFRFRITLPSSILLERLAA
jgi:HPt (histidine-containing phosphotransfer) domain-containing protein